MSLRDNLVFYATFGNTNPPFTQTDYIGGNHLLSLFGGLSSVPGPYGQPCIHFDYDAPDPNGVSSGRHGGFLAAQNTLGGFSPYIFSAHGPFSVAVRFKATTLDPVQAVHRLLMKGIPQGNDYEYQIVLVWDGTKFYAGANFHITGPGFNGFLSFALPDTIGVGEWHLAVLTWDGNGNAKFSLDGGDQQIYGRVGAASVSNILNLAVGQDSTVSTSAFDGDMQQLAIWQRELSPADIIAFRDGGLLAFTAPEQCDAIECCPEPGSAVAYSSGSPTPSGTVCVPGTPGSASCLPVPLVDIDPPSGTTVSFPSFVFLSSNRADATIYYTTDGSTPTLASARYTGPFEVISVDAIVQAFAVVDGCDPGPYAVASYVIVTPPNEEFKFGYSCDTTDKVGRWGDFAANGAVDYHWTIQLRFVTVKTITRIELYQVNAKGVWTSGQAWSTDEYINPKEGPTHFHVFPLGVFDDGNNPNLDFGFTNQLNVAYLATFMALSANKRYYWTPIGQPAAPLNGYFKLLIFLADGTVMQSIISTTCSDPTPLCPPPIKPTVASTCTGVDVTFTETVGKSYQIKRAVTSPGDGIYRLLTSGVVATNPQTYHDTSAVVGPTYCYRICIDNGSCGVQTSDSACGQRKCSPVCSIAVNPTTFNSGDSVTVSFASSCSTTIVITDNHGHTFGPFLPNISSSFSDSPTADTCYTIAATNTCGTTTAQACTLLNAVVNPCQNPAIVPDSVTISPVPLATVVAACQFSAPAGTAVPWNGKLVRATPTGCAYNLPVLPANQFWSQPGPLGPFQLSGGTLSPSIGQWTLVLRGFDGVNSQVIWIGKRTGGINDPTGIYTRTNSSGCLNGPVGPATLSVS